MPVHTKSIAETTQELWDLLRDYAKQETVDPIKDLGRFLKWGLVGSVLLTMGVFFLALGVLRLLQTQTGELFDDGVLSSVPYLIVFASLIVVIVIAASRINKRTSGGNR